MESSVKGPAIDKIRGKLQAFSVFCGDELPRMEIHPHGVARVLLATSPSPVGTFHGDDCIHDN